MVLLKEIFEKVDFEKKSEDDKKAEGRFAQMGICAYTIGAPIPRSSPYTIIGKICPTKHP